MAVQFSEEQFSRRPSAEQMPVRYELERVPPGGFAGIIILSGDVLGSLMHWYGGTTKPCIGDKCEIDHDSLRPFWRGYLFAWKPRAQEIFCVEVTPAAMAPLDAAYRTFTSLRGCKLNLSRIPELRTGRMKAQIFAPAANLDSLPDCPSLRKYLCRVWQMTYVATTTIRTDESLKLEATSQSLALKIKRA
jgi:hypothetical protein